MPSLPELRGEPGEDQVFLRRKDRPNYNTGDPEATLVDLFCGCGGMSLGMAYALHELGYSVKIALAIDEDPEAIAVFRDNFPGARAEPADILSWFDGELDAPLTARERAVQNEVGHPPTVLLGGPPCQGNSDLNNHTRRRDPRNALYARMARAARVLQPTFVLVENVPAVVHDMAGVVDETRRSLEEDGYKVSMCRAELWRLGVPQTRKRHFLLASRHPAHSTKILSRRLVEGFLEEPNTVRWAIEDLMSKPVESEFDRASTPQAQSIERIQWLFANDAFDLPDNLRPDCHRSGGHSYKSIYGRLRWDEPAQTITTGFGSMGQGRYVHPACPRTLTPHEAARLQGFPDFFRFDSVRKRTTLARLIGNAVPPLVTMRIAEMLFAPPSAGPVFASGVSEAR